MNENMVHVMNKINEMQLKLNLINENIEEIKNVQKNLEKKNKKLNSIYSKNNSAKNNHHDRILKETKNNSNSKFIYKKNLSKSSRYINFNLNKASYNNKKEKTLKYNNSQVYNNYEFQDLENDIQDDNMSQKSLMYNYKAKRIGYLKKNRTSLSSFDNDKNSFMEQRNNKFNYNSRYLSQINDYLYNKISINKNNCYFKKKGLNYSNYLDKVDSKNNLDNNSKINYKNINLITTKKNIKIKKLSEQNENKLNRSNIINNNEKKFDFNKNVFNNKKRVFYGIKEQNNNNRQKGINLEQNYLHDNKENIINNYLKDNNKNNYMTAKNKIKNSSFHGLNNLNNNINNSNSENIIYFKKRKTIDSIPDINSKNKVSLYLNEQKIKYKENIKEDEKNHLNNISSNTYTKMKNSKIFYDKNNKNNKNHIQNNNKKKTKDIKYEQILLDIINITNQYNNKQDKINVDNVIDEYKMLLNNMKIKNEFIYNLINIYNNSTKSNLNCREPKSLILIWNWIINKQNNFENNSSLYNEDIQYRKLCQKIMMQYKLKNIEQLKMFINNSFRKIDNNDNFLEGIKKILLEK